MARARSERRWLSWREALRRSEAHQQDHHETRTLPNLCSSCPCTREVGWWRKRKLSLSRGAKRRHGAPKMGRGLDLGQLVRTAVEVRVALRRADHALLRLAQTDVAAEEPVVIEAGKTLGWQMALARATDAE